MNKFVFTVSDLNRYVRSLVEGDSNLSSLYVSGEISNFTDHYRSGHLYFSLSDGASTVKCVMFKSAAAWLKFRPENGMSVICRGRASVYERDGVYQFYCEDMQPDGAGALALAFEQLKERLGNEGLFDAEHKRPLPVFPKKIGVITSDTGAALRDIINVLGRRFPAAEMLFHPALVQGQDAPQSLIKALDRMYKTDADVIIIGRGGGSAEDLSAFNDESLARKVFESPVPIISAVGHETDFTICDFVADLRAPTPSAAAELAVPDRAELYEAVQVLYRRLTKAARGIIDNGYIRLDKILASDILKDPLRVFEIRRQENSRLLYSLNMAYKASVIEKIADYNTLVSKLDALSPLKVLKRGYANVLKNGVNIKSAAQARKGDKLQIAMADGRINCTVDETEVL